MYIYLTVLPFFSIRQIKIQRKILDELQKLTEAKSYLKLVIELFFLIGQLEYGVFALIVQALDSAIQQINHYSVDKYWGN